MVFSKLFKKKVGLLNTQEGFLTVRFLACAALNSQPESHLGPQLSDHNRLAPYYQSVVGHQ